MIPIEKRDWNEIRSLGYFSLDFYYYWQEYCYVLIRYILFSSCFISSSFSSTKVTRRNYVSGQKSNKEKQLQHIEELYLFRDLSYRIASSLSDLACSRLSIGGSERKQRRAKNQAIQGERAGARGLCRTDPITEGLEQAISDHDDMLNNAVCLCNVWQLYSGTPLYGHPLNTDTRIVRTVSFVPTKMSYIFTKINPLNTDTG